MKANVNRLSCAERKAMNMEINRQIAENMKGLNTDLCTMILYFLHEHCGHGKKRLEEDWAAFMPLFEELIKRYEFGEEETPWACSYKLKELGVDCEELSKGCKPLVDFKI